VISSIERRTFLSALGGAAASSLLRPGVARAQQQATPLVGMLNSATPQSYASRVAAFLQGLSETGYAEGKNVAIEYRWADGQYDRLPSLAAELVRHQVNVIAAITTPAALAVKAASTAIPTVFEVGGDPVELGLVASLSRPGGSVTGVSLLNAELGPKRLELLHELVPTAATVAALLNPANPNTGPLSKDLQAAAHSMGLDLHIVHAGAEGDFGAAFQTIGQLRAGALFIGTDPLFNGHSGELAASALRLGIPAIYQYRDFAAAGGLLSYGGSFTEPLRLVGMYTGRVLKGEKPADLPVQQSTKVELYINLKTAKALGLTVPLSLLGRADEVIE
jgi:putative ABC transport system substrate-binding protein